MVAQFNEFDQSLQQVNSSLETFVQQAMKPGQGVQGLSDGLAEQLKLAQDRILVKEGCRLREAAQQIAREDAPHSAVARFNRNLEFNIATPLKDHLANHEKLRKQLEKREVCLAALKEALRQVELCDTHALQDADLRRKLAKSEFQASKETFERINRSVFEWLYTLEEHRDDILDSCLQTLKHLQYDFLASAAHAISDVLPERMAFRRMTEMMPECLEAHVQHELRSTQECPEDGDESFSLRLVERLAREGKERPGAAPESAPSSQPVDPLSLSSLLSHGFEEGPARRALRQTGNDTQAAMELLLGNDDVESVRAVAAWRAQLERVLRPTSRTKSAKFARLMLVPFDYRPGPPWDELCLIIGREFRNLRPGEPETLPPAQPSYELFFRRPAEMPALERRALELCLRQGGRALDLGAGVSYPDCRQPCVGTAAARLADSWLGVVARCRGGDEGAWPGISRGFVLESADLNKVRHHADADEHGRSGWHHRTLPAAAAAAPAKLDADGAAVAGSIATRVAGRQPSVEKDA
ncbi:unnamed protein product [Symbiodinium pilosum]|uniref:UBA domain-containing protein n=1 Tax=Symbiodinium pilosum TaxID=2952 RepID=A0A812SD39_SYMPI|nr:unnamed protein product [Symbiodinium pilosum]